jgi:hypothetical protein
MRRKLVTGIVFAVALTAVAPSANAAVTVGQVGDPGASTCVSAYDWPQQSVHDGTSYTVPSMGGITSWRATSWSSFGGSTDIQLKMKFFRPTGPDSYQVVGHAGPENVHAGTLTGNTFPANVVVKAGDVLGLHTTGSGECAFETLFADDTYGEFNGDLADGQSDTFSFFHEFRMDIAAQLTPNNAFTASGVSRNRKKGNATLSFDLPNPGTLVGAGNGAKTASAGAHSSKTVGAGAATLLVKAKGKKAKKLRENGKVKLAVNVTYTPTGGEASTTTVKVKLRKS